MEASLTCAVCLGVFREPVTLPRCSHNFCKSCVLECATPHMWTVAQSRNGHYSTVSCPLCRKISTLPCGLAALPINTTLAEVVRLLPPNGRARENQAEGAAAGEEPDSEATCCVEHPEYKLELFCKICEQVCCGKCVSLRHQGMFHNVNLLDIIYQEEKLVFFNSLKTLREIHEKFTTETSEDDKNADSILKSNEDIITSAFDEAQKALDLKKQQLLELVRQQHNASIRRSEMRKVTKARRRTTVEGLLKECENIVDDYEPKSFLQVACGLNKRMKCNLELIEFCADQNEDRLRSEPQFVNIQALLDAVSSLKITSSSKDVSQQNGGFSFKSVSRTWNDGISTAEKYCPVQDQELIYLQGQMQKMSIRYVCITKMPEYQHLSYEELRLKYYESSTVHEREAVSADQQPFIYNNFHFKTSLINSAKPTRLKRQDAFDGNRACSRISVYKVKAVKIEPEKMEQKDSLSLCALKKDNTATEGQTFPSSSIRGPTTIWSSGIKVENQPTIYSDISNKPNFCFGKSEGATNKKSSRNEKSCKKLKPTFQMPRSPSAGLIVSTSAVAAESFSTLNSVAGNAEEDMSVNSASSEEFYDASCNIDPDVREPHEQISRGNSTDTD